MVWRDRSRDEPMIHRYHSCLPEYNYTLETIASGGTKRKLKRLSIGHELTFWSLVASTGCAFPEYTSAYRRGRPKCALEDPDRPVMGMTGTGVSTG